MVIRVTPREPIDPDRFSGAAPAEVAAALRAAGQPATPGLWNPRSGPVQLLFSIGGPDRLADGRRVVEELTRRGYEAELSVSP